MDTQRYTRKVRTCEKDLAKAKENLEKWGHHVPAASSTSNGVAQVEDNSISNTTAVKEEPQPTVASTPDQAANSNTGTDPSRDNKQQSKQEKGKVLLQVHIAIITTITKPFSFCFRASR